MTPSVAAVFAAALAGFMDDDFAEQRQRQGEPLPEPVTVVRLQAALAGL